MKGEFEEYVKKAMEEVVKNNQHNHPLCRETSIQEYFVDEKTKTAAFVLFEHIDTDRCTPQSSGWLGDQYRYSVWYVKEGESPKELYEDHAWIRDRVSDLTGSRGRDCSIQLEKLLPDGVIAKITPKNAEGGSTQKQK